jgi:hypothetical protein
MKSSSAHNACQQTGNTLMYNEWHWTTDGKIVKKRGTEKAASMPIMVMFLPAEWKVCTVE